MNPATIKSLAVKICGAFHVHYFELSLVLKGYGPDVLRLPDGRSEPIFVTYDLCK